MPTTDRPGLHHFRHFRHPYRLSRTVRSRYLCRRTTHQGDRYPQGARRQRQWYRRPAEQGLHHACRDRRAHRLPRSVVGHVQWLETFAYRTEISWWIFLVAGAVALTIALLTVSIQTIRAALANPIKSLRSE